MHDRQTYSIEQIKDMLLARIDQVVHHYAPPASGSHTTFGKYFTLNPGRPDKSVGSFWIQMSGPNAGRWADHAMPPLPGSRSSCAAGDIIDLIKMSCHCLDNAAALKEARAFLGLETMDPAERRRQEARAEHLKEQRRKAEAEERDKRERRRRAGHRLWLDAAAGIKNTPVEFYLRDQRGIDLAVLGRQPRVLRYLPACRYYHVDDKSGEVFDGHYPAMVALVVSKAGKVMSCHRTWLAQNDRGLWDKAPVPKPKKVLGSADGGWISLWRGIGPRGGKPASLNQAPPGTHVYMAEGIEDALSGVMLLPEQRFIAGVTLGGMAAADLPDCVSTLTLIADEDAAPDAQRALQHAIETHQRAGREVRVWKNRHGGKDLNDALRAAKEDKDKGAA